MPEVEVGTRVTIPAPWHPTGRLVYRVAEVLPDGRLRLASGQVVREDEVEVMR